MVREAVEAGFELDTYSVSTSPIFGPFVDKAREALRSLDKYPDLDAYLDRTMENNPEANELMAATVYLAARPSPQSTADALAPRADHLSFAIEEKPEEVKDKLSFGARLADFYARISARAMTSFWWLLEILPTIKVAQRADAHGKKKVSFWCVWTPPRLLLPHTLTLRFPLQAQLRPRPHPSVPPQLPLLRARTHVRRARQARFRARQ